MLKNNLIKLNINKEIQNIALPKGEILFLSQQANMSLLILLIMMQL